MQCYYFIAYYLFLIWNLELLLYYSSMAYIVVNRKLLAMTCCVYFDYKYSPNQRLITITVKLNI